MGGRDKNTEDGEVPAAERRRLLGRLGAPAGLCASCAHLLLVSSPRSVFVRCGLAVTDPAFVRYPPLPVRSCAGYLPEMAGGRPEDSAG